MSWFSLSMQGKEIVDTHSTFSQFCTGSYLSKKIFDSFIRHNSLNTMVRNVAANQLNTLIAPRLVPASKKAAEMIIKTSLNTKKLAYVTVKLKDHMLQAPGEHLLGMTKHGARLALYAAKSLVKTIPNPFVSSPDQQDPIEHPKRKVIPLKGNYGEQEKAAVLNLLRQGAVSEAIQLHTLYTLMPTCEQAVQRTFESMTKVVVGEAYDLIIKKSCSVIVMPIIYKLALTTFESLGNYYQVPYVSYLNHLPNPSSLLAISAAGNTLQMAGVVWKEYKKETDKTDLDKEELKKIALKHAKESVSKKVKENVLLTHLGVVQQQEDIDRIVNTLISEIIDFYWNDLHETKILGLPLVT